MPSSSSVSASEGGPFPLGQEPHLLECAPPRPGCPGCSLSPALSRAPELPGGRLSDGQRVIMRKGERGAPRAAALTLHISDPPGPSSIRSCSLSGRLIAGGQDGWRDRQPRNP
ncbi:hypothetical protein NN561_002091 [Cricetulus griseus]